MVWTHKQPRISRHLANKMQDPAIASDALAPPEPTARHRRKSSKASRSPIMGESSSEDDDAFGDDFDEFEEGVQDEDFDDFEDDFQQPETSQGNFTPVQQTVLPYVSIGNPRPLLICH